MQRFTELRNESRKILSEIVPLQKPFALTIDPSSICNFRCKQCIQANTGKEVKKLMMSFQQFKKIVDDIKAWKGNKLKVVKLYNRGEPLLNAEFITMLEYLRFSGITERIELTSNCSMLTEEISEKLVEYGLDYFRASIYSPFQEKNESITKTKMKVEQIYDNIYILKQKKLLKGRDKPFIAVKMFETSDEKERQFFISKYKDIADELFFEKMHDFSGENSNGSVLLKSEKVVCPWPFYSLTIQSDGTVDCCCVDWEDKTKLGNAFEESIEQIWNGEKLNSFRVAQLERKRKSMDSCKNCSLYLTDAFTVDSLDDLSIDEYMGRGNFRNDLDK